MILAARDSGGPAALVASVADTSPASADAPSISGRTLVYGIRDFEAGEFDLFRAHLDGRACPDELRDAPATPGVEDVEIAVDGRDIVYTDDAGGDAIAPGRGMFRIASDRVRWTRDCGG